MTASEFVDAINSNRELIWNDPDPIEGQLTKDISNIRTSFFDDEELEDYDVVTVWFTDGGEADVLISEIEFK